MSARERREKRDRPAPLPPRNEAKAAKMRADRLAFYDEANEVLDALTDRDIAEMMGQLITQLNVRLERTRLRILLALKFETGDTNLVRHEANLHRIGRHQGQAVALLKLINNFGNDDLAIAIRTWAKACDPSLNPEEGP